MARNSTARGKVVRRLGLNIYGNEKYDRLLKRKPHGPGKAPRDRQRGNKSEYQRQLLEKQKLKFTYGVTERQLRNIYRGSTGKAGKTGDNMVAALESRLDNILFRGGFASTRPQARQLATHGCFLVNGHRVNIPSLKLFPGDVVSLRPGEGRNTLIRSNLVRCNHLLPAWMERLDDSLILKITGIPRGKEEDCPADMQLVVEYFAR
jgi:small subunit ribosomal protein S4